MGNGLYFLCHLDDTAAGLSFYAIWESEKKDFQVGLMIGFLTMGFGYEF